MQSQWCRIWEKKGRERANTNGCMMGDISRESALNYCVSEQALEERGWMGKQFIPCLSPSVLHWLEWAQATTRWYFLDYWGSHWGSRGLSGYSPASTKVKWSLLSNQYCA